MCRHYVFLSLGVSIVRACVRMCVSMASFLHEYMHMHTHMPVCMWSCSCVKTYLIHVCERARACMHALSNILGCCVYILFLYWQECEVEVKACGLSSDISSSLKSVKCYPVGRKIHFIPSIFKIHGQMLYRFVQYTRRHLMSLISHF